MIAKRSWLRWVVLVPVTLAAGWLLYWATANERFCWLVFGPKGDLRLLLRRAGNEWFLDRDGDGRFGGSDERLGRWDPSHKIAITNPADGRIYTLSNLRFYHDKTIGHRCLIEADIAGSPAFRQLADAGLGRFRRGAGLAHFDGPLTVQAQSIAWQLPPDLALRRGDKPTDLRALIGTLDAATECWTTVYVMGTNSQSLFPTNVHPFVDVEFPAKTAGARPIQVRYPLKEFC